MERFEAQACDVEQRPSDRSDAVTRSEQPATICPRGQMQQRWPRAVDQGRRLLELPHVSFTQVELDSLLARARSSLSEHRLGEESIPITHLPVA
jgi:hypothetical protein